MTTAAGRATGPSRRQLLEIAGLGLAGLAVGASAGCRGRATAGPSISAGDQTAGADEQAADAALVVAAIGDEAALGTFATAGWHRYGGLRSPLRDISRRQALHVARLRASLRGQRPAVATGHPRLPGSAQAVTAQIAAMAATARDARWSDCLNSTGAGLAALFASIAASHAQTAVEIGGDGSAIAVPSPDSITGPAALQPCLAAEHAAVYGYGVLGGVLDAGDTDSAAGQRAVTAYDAHRTRRDLLAELIAAARSTPVAALASYRLPVDVHGNASASRLARILEDRCATVYVRAVALTVAEARLFTSRTVADCATRALAWGGSPTAFPGLPTR